MSTPPKNWDARKGGIVRKRRQALGWDQRELAERVDVHVNSVQRWEAGTQYPGRRLGRLEAVLGIVIDDEEEQQHPAVPPGLLREIMYTEGLTMEQRQAVIAAVEATLAREAGAAGGSSREPAGGAGPERRRTAS